MKRLRMAFAGLALVATLALSGCARDAAASGALANPGGPGVAYGETFAVSDSAAASAQGKGPDKDKKPTSNKDDKPGKGNNGNGANNGKGNGVDKGNSAGDNRAAPSDHPGRGLGAWWKDFSSRLFGPGNQIDLGGWQRGRFRDAFPAVFPDGWQTQERGDASLTTGQWQGQGYVFQMTRSVQVEQRSLQEWVNSDVQRLGLSNPNVRMAQVDRVQVAVITGVKDAGYACPVAYVYMWTQNPAGNNQRQVMGVISQTPDTPCNTAGLNAFVDAYLAQLGSANRTASTPTPVSVAGGAPTARPTVAPLVTPPATPVGNGSGWQQSRFFNAFSFAYPQAWTMDRLGDTAHLQGDYNGRAYVMDIVWVRDAPRVGLEQWARADLADLGASLEGTRIDYVSQNGAQVAIASGVRVQGYSCPVVRIYVVADNSAGGGQRSYTATLAQANGQTCDPQALEDLAYRMLQQA